MKDSLAKYFSDYNKNLENKLGKSFSYGDFFNAVEKHEIKIDGFQGLNEDKKLEFPWLDELEIVTEKIMAIASKPRTHIRFEKDVKRADKAVKIDNYDIIETLKVPEFWHLKDDKYLPEKVFTDLHEIDTAIYENRFLINLIDKMIMFLSKNISQIMDLIKKINRRFIDQHVPVSDVDIIKDIANYNKENEDGTKSAFRKKDLSAQSGTLLTQSSSPYVDLLRRLLAARATLSHVLSTPFYKTCKKARPLPDSGVHITNMLAGDKLYAPCYTFYLHLLPLLASESTDESGVNYKDYHNYVLTNLLVAFENIGFTNVNGKKNAKDFAHLDKLLVLKKYELVKGNITCTVDTNSEDHIDMTFELKVQDDDIAPGKKINRVSIDLVPTTNAEYTSDQELIPYFKRKINSRLIKDYNNAFIVTTVDNTQKEDVIICSPNIYKIDANVRSMIESCIIFAQGDTFIYRTICPVCGYYVDGELEDGNCYCANCESVYSVFEHTEGKSKKETVWIKRLKNPEKI